VDEVRGNAAKVAQALKVSESDKKNLLLLEQEIARTWKMVNAAQEKEKETKRCHEKLHSGVEALYEKVTSSKRMLEAKHVEHKDLLAEVDGLQKVSKLVHSLSLWVPEFPPQDRLLCQKRYLPQRGPLIVRY